MVVAVKAKQETDLESLIDLYLLRCEVEGKSRTTQKAYTWSLRRLAKIAREEGFPRDVTQIAPTHLYSYLGRFSQLSLESRHRYHREVSCFFNWLQIMGYIERSPFFGVKKVRLPLKIVQPFTPEDILRLLACCDSGDPVGARDRAILLALLDTGIRVGELVSLELQDLDVVARRLRVMHGKGNKQRVVAFGKDCEDSLVHYLGFRSLNPGNLFVSTDCHGTLQPDAPLRSDAVKHMLRRVGERAGVAKVHAHRFRHTFATWAIEQDARELDVQYLLGRSTPDMVRRYSATYNSEKAAQAHARFSPMNRLQGRLNSSFSADDSRLGTSRI